MENKQMEETKSMVTEMVQNKIGPKQIETFFKSMPYRSKKVEISQYKSNESCGYAIMQLMLNHPDQKEDFLDYTIPRHMISEMWCHSSLQEAEKWCSDNGYEIGYCDLKETK